jgi:hypothetical protein
MLLCCTYINAQTLCDSLSYSISNSSTLTVVGVNSSSDSLSFRWGVCDNTTCYSAIGDTAYFPLVSPFDTVKVCFDISPQWSCNDCQYVILIEGSWQIINIITHVSEIQALPVNGKMYDLLGRELEYIPAGKMYIRNNKLYISK